MLKETAVDQTVKERIASEMNFLNDVPKKIYAPWMGIPDPPSDNTVISSARAGPPRLLTTHELTKHARGCRLKGNLEDSASCDIDSSYLR
jgi:hypothetical protein